MPFEEFAKDRRIWKIEVMRNLSNRGIRIMQTIPGFEQYLLINHLAGCLSGKFLYCGRKILGRYMQLTGIGQHRPLFFIVLLY